jgi:hypothetical protein
MIHFKLLEKQEQSKHKTNRWRETIKIRAKINEIETKKLFKEINETNNWFFEKINMLNSNIEILERNKE